MCVKKTLLFSNCQMRFASALKKMHNMSQSWQKMYYQLIE